MITSLNEPVSGYSIGATAEPGEPGASTGARTVWWRWVAPQSSKYRVVVEIPRDGVGSKLGIYRGSSLTQLVEELRVTGSSETIDDVSITRADGVFEATADTQYSFVLDTGFQESLC